MDSQQGYELTHHFIEIDVKSAKKRLQSCRTNSATVTLLLCSITLAERDCSERYLLSHTQPRCVDFGRTEEWLVSN
jgi:hypothetical protein